MTVGAEITPIIHDGDDATTSFSVPWVMEDEDYIEVRYLTAAGVESILTLTTDYTVAGVTTNPGSITLVSLVPATGDKLAILPDIPADQESIDLEDNGAFEPESIEAQFDRIARTLAELKAEMARAVRATVFNELASLGLPAPSAGKVIGWNSGGDALENIEAGSLSLEDESVTTAKIAANAVTTAKILDGAVTAAKIGATVIANPLAALLDAAGYTIDNPLFKHSRETVAEADFTSNVLTLDANLGNVQHVTLDANATTVTLSNFPAGTYCAMLLYIKQDGTGSRTITWPASVKWPGNTAPTLSTGAAKIDGVAIASFDGGTTYEGQLFTSDLTNLAFA